MLHQHENNVSRYWFDSLAELGRYIDETPATWRLKSSRNASYGHSWDLGVDYQTAVRLAKDGWVEGAQRAQQALKVFAPATPHPDTRVGFYGFMPHVPRFCAGAPDNMIRHAFPPERGCGRVLTIIVPICANAGTDATCMANFGLGLAQYVNQLETQGIRCEVIAAAASDMYATRKRLAFAWRIKRADQPLDLAVMAFAIGHPAMFRRLGFALIERSDVREQKGYGRSQDVKLGDVLNCPAGAVVLNGMLHANSRAPTPEAALEYIGEQIDKALANPEADG